MDKKIKALKEQFRTASAKQIKDIDKEIDSLSQKQPAAFSKAMVKAAKETAKEIDDLLLKEKLKDVLPALSVTYFAKTYFKKTPQWFYQRLNGNNVNGKPASFTPKELETLSLALNDVSQRIKHSATFV